MLKYHNFVNAWGCTQNSHIWDCLLGQTRILFKISGYGPGSYYSITHSGNKSLLQNISVYKANGPVKISTGVVKEAHYKLAITLL